VGGIFADPEEELRRAVPERHDDRRVGLQRGPVLAREAEVADLEDAVVAEKQVRGLDVPETIWRKKTFEEDI
jgi:hypothetical protein